MRGFGARTLPGAVLLGALGLLTSAVGCSQEDAPGPATDSPAPQAPAADPVAPAPVPTRPLIPRVAHSPQQFKQALARRFDDSRLTTVPLSPEGGILTIPNGWAPHAMVAVKNPDGTIGQRCVSSSAEAEALVNKFSQGGTP